MYMAPLGISLGQSKRISLIIFETFWVRSAIGNILTSIVSSVQFSFWATSCSPRYDHFWVPCWPRVSENAKSY